MINEKQQTRNNKERKQTKNEKEEKRGPFWSAIWSSTEGRPLPCSFMGCPLLVSCVWYNPIKRAYYAMRKPKLNLIGFSLDCDRYAPHTTLCQFSPLLLLFFVYSL